MSRNSRNGYLLILNNRRIRQAAKCPYMPQLIYTNFKSDVRGSADRITISSPAMVVLFFPCYTKVTHRVRADETLLDLSATHLGHYKTLLHGLVGTIWETARLFPGTLTNLFVEDGKLSTGAFCSISLSPRVLSVAFLRGKTARFFSPAPPNPTLPSTVEKHCCLFGIRPCSRPSIA